jgi:DNA repair exonuclease SbcCD ATPase subunit
MKPIKLTIKNGCQYSDYVYNYRVGVTGVIGRNGAGKTNLVHTLQQFAITGKTNIDGKTKSDLLQWGASSGYTIFEFEHHGLPYKLTRALKGSKILLESGDNEWKQAEADQVMEEILGMSFKVFHEVCFVSQGKLWAILDMTHSKRMEYFQKLTDAWQAEGIRTMLDKAVRRVPTYPDRTEELDVLKGNLKSYEDMIAFQQKQLEEHTALKGKYDKNMPEVDKVLAMLTETEYNANVATAETRLYDVQQQLAAVATVGELGDVVDYPQELIDRKAVADLQLSLTLVNVDLERLPKEEEPSSEELKKEDAVLTTLYARLETICPTCLRPRDDSEDIDTDAINSQITEQKQLTARLTKEYADAKIAYDNYIKEDARLNARAEELENSITAKGYKPDDPIDFDQKELDKALEEYDIYKTKLKQYNENKDVIDKLKADQAVAENTLKEAQAAKYIRDSRMTDAKEVKVQYQTILEQITRMETELKIAENNRDNTQDSIKVFEADMVKREKADTVRVKFERCRDLLHREKLPKVVMGSLLNGLNHHMNEMLIQFDMGFDALLDEDFNFKVACIGNDNASASDLSGGQKVILAIAFHIGLGRLLGGTIPFMVLDEPTNHVDVHNKPVLRDALMSLKGSGSAGVEYIFVTHDDVLQPTFDRQIEII